MSRTIYVPDGDAGDETLCRLIPSIWRMAEGRRNDRRGGDHE